MSFCNVRFANKEENIIFAKDIYTLRTMNGFPQQCLYSHHT